MSGPDLVRQTEFFSRATIVTTKGGISHPSPPALAAVVSVIRGWSKLSVSVPEPNNFGTALDYRKRLNGTLYASTQSGVAG